MLLALDSSTECISVGIKQKEAIIREEFSKRDQSEKFPTLIRSLVPDFTKISGVVVGVGPGSLTGTRIAISIAKGISHGRTIPIVGVSSLDAQKKYLESKKVSSYTIILDKTVIFRKSPEGEVQESIDFESLNSLKGEVIDNPGVCGGIFQMPSGFACGLLELCDFTSASYTLEGIVQLKPLILRETKFLTEQERGVDKNTER